MATEAFEKSVSIFVEVHYACKIACIVLGIIVCNACLSSSMTCPSLRIDRTLYMQRSLLMGP